MKRFLIAVCVVLAGRGAMVGSEQRQSVAMEFFDTGDVSNLTGYGNCQWLCPLDEPNEALTSEPGYGSEKRVYYAARYGDAVDNIHTLVIDESGGTGTGFDTVYADLNNDNRIDASCEKFAFKLGTTRIDNSFRIRLFITAGGQVIPYSFAFKAFPYSRTAPSNPEEIHATCRNSSVVVGRAVFDGKECRIAIADLNSNGLFNDTEQGIFHGDRFFVDLNDDEKFDGRDDLVEQHPYGRYTKVAGRWYSITASPGGTHVDIEPATPPLGKLTAPAMVSQVDLHSEVQSQAVILEEGSAQAVAGAFRLASIRLSASDERGRQWTFTNSFPGEPDRQVTIETGGQTSIPNPLPLTISVEAVSEAPFDVVAVTLHIAGAIGGAVSCPRMAKPRPVMAFQVVDIHDRVVSSGRFEYG